MSHSSPRLAAALLAFSSLSLGLFTGCGATTSFSGPTASSNISGKVYGGQQPLAGSLVTVWAIGMAGYGSPATNLASTTSDNDGAFSIDSYTCPAPAGGDTQVYITAQGGSPTPGDNNGNIALAAGLGTCSSAQNDLVDINEVTTAVTAFALGQFFTTSLGTPSTINKGFYADDFGTDPADLASFSLSNTATIPMLAYLPGGTVNLNTAATSTAPAINIEAAKIYSIANTLSACVNDSYDSTTMAFDNCASLFSYTQQPFGSTLTPTDTLQAAVEMALYPWNNVSALFELAPKQSPFAGLPLTPEPNDWTIGVSYTSSAYGLSIARPYVALGKGTPTSASIDIDTKGNIWFPTNSQASSSSTGIATFNPATYTFSGPYLTGHFLQPQYLAIDSNGLAWITDTYFDMTYGYVDTTAPGTGHTYLQDTYGEEGSFDLGPIAADASGDVFFGMLSDNAGSLENKLVEWSPTSDLPFQGINSFTTLSAPPTGIVATSDFAYVSTSGHSTACNLEYVDGYPPYIANNIGTSQVLASTSSPCASGGVAFASGGTNVSVIANATTLNEICTTGSTDSCGNTTDPDYVDLPEGIATDGAGSQWYAMSGNGTIFVNGANFSTTYFHNSGNGDTITTPYAIAIDGSGNVWIANASCVSTGDEPCTPSSFTLSEIIGAAAPTITPLSAQMGSGGALVGTPPLTSSAGGHPVPFRGSAPGMIWNH